MKKKMFKKVVSIALILCVLLAMGGCQNSSTTESEGGSGKKSSDSNVEEGVELTLWIFLNPESEEDPRNLVLKEIVEEYNATNTMGNTVVVESIHWSKFESQAIQAAGAQSGPDILNIYTDQLKQHIAGGTIQPMTEYAEEYIPEIEGYSYTADSLKIDGEIYTLPWESRTFTYWYRTDIFESMPEDLEDLASEAGSKSTAMDQGFVIGLSDNSNAASFMESFIPFIRSAGGSLFDAEGKAVFNSEAGVQVLEYFKSLIDSGAMDNTTISLTVDEIVDAFKAGTILSCNAGTQRASAIRSSELNDVIASAPILGFSDGENPSPAVVAGQSLGIGKYTEHPEAAFDFIKTFYTHENQVKWLQANVLPVRSSVYDDSDIQEMSNYEELKSWNEYAATGQVEFYPEDYTELSAELVKAAQEVIFNEADAQEKLDKVADWYNEKNGLD